VGLYLLLEGKVELRRGALLLDQIGPNEFFGELAALDGLPRSADAMASEDTLVLRLERDDLLSMIEEIPGLAIGLVQLLSSRVRRLEERLDEASTPIGGSS
jgi:CRP-like cAMP-binding protein